MRFLVMADEVEKVQNLALFRQGCDTTLLIRPSRDTLLEVLARDRLDVLVFDAHGAPHGVHLCEDVFLEASVLALASARSGAYLAVYNFCHSIYVAKQACDLGLQFAIGWTAKFSEQVAQAWEETFCSAFLIKPDVPLAFQQSLLMMERFYPLEERPLLFQGPRRRRWLILAILAGVMVMASLAGFLILWLTNSWR
jgi:hypothetical protein